ncbi:MAG: hypothetical protein WKF75_06005 [Singulisphaera sp.]
MDPVRAGVVFALASTSIACLLANFMGWGRCGPSPSSSCSRRSGLALSPRGTACGAASLPGWHRHGGGAIAAVAYDLFRVPFVFADTWGIASIVPG